MKTMMIHISKSLTLTTTTISSGFNYFFHKDVHNVRALAEKKSSKFDMMKQKPQLSKSCSHFEKLAALSWETACCQTGHL